jgi:hypothetical protein
MNLTALESAINTSDYNIKDSLNRKIKLYDVITWFASGKLNFGFITKISNETKVKYILLKNLLAEDYKEQTLTISTVQNKILIITNEILNDDNYADKLTKFIEYLSNGNKIKRQYVNDVYKTYYIVSQATENEIKQTLELCQIDDISSVNIQLAVKFDDFSFNVKDPSQTELFNKFIEHKNSLVETSPEFINQYVILKDSTYIKVQDINSQNIKHVQFNHTYAPEIYTYFIDNKSGYAYQRLKKIYFLIDNNWYTTDIEYERTAFRTDTKYVLSQISNFNIITQYLNFTVNIFN